MTKVHFMSPDGARLLFDVDGVHLDGLGEETASDPHPITGHQVCYSYLKTNLKQFLGLRRSYFRGKNEF